MEFAFVIVTIIIGFYLILDKLGKIESKINETNRWVDKLFQKYNEIKKDSML